jgi:hypothetical protein
MEHAIKMHNDYLATLKEADIEGDFTIQDMFQPIPTFFAENGIEKGGNMLGLDRFEDNLIRKHFPSHPIEPQPLTSPPSLANLPRLERALSRRLLPRVGHAIH